MGKFSKQEAKKPITKRWWFWTLVVFFVVGIIGNLAGLQTQLRRNPQFQLPLLQLSLQRKLQLKPQRPSRKQPLRCLLM